MGTRSTTGIPWRFISSESVLAEAAFSLGAESIGNLSLRERNLSNGVTGLSCESIRGLEEEIKQGHDPLGSALCSLRPQEVRRQQGAFYTPALIVRLMLDWAEAHGIPERVVEPGSGTAPFLLDAARRFPNADLIAVETDPLAALLARANLAVLGLRDRAHVLVEDFRSVDIGRIEGRTLYVGNPPYVRHHAIDPYWKDWLKKEAAGLGIKASTLAGLHTYFFLSIARRASPGDYGALVTAAEWLDVNYGRLIKELFQGRLGGHSVSIIEPEIEPFRGVATTGAITTFEIESRPNAARFRRITDLQQSSQEHPVVCVGRDRLAKEPRWTHFTKTVPQRPAGYIELGELCAVHRGQVTGANRVWIEGAHSVDLPEEALFPAVTKARELFQSGFELVDARGLRRVIDLPVDLSEFSPDNLRCIDRFLRRVEQMGVRHSYTSRHRKVWWSVGLRDPAPILATYMARRPPAFVLNKAGARHLNIAHGIYPKEPLDGEVLRRLAKYLRTTSTTVGGRVYSGGLTKFEPREMERIPIPHPNQLGEMDL